MVAENFFGLRFARSGVYLERVGASAKRALTIELDDTGEIKAACLRMGLIAPEERVRITLLTGGVSSLIARVDTPRGSVCVKRALPKLKVTAEWHAPVERNRAEVQWMKAVAAITSGFVPRVIAEDPIGQAFAMEYLPPANYAVWKEQLRDGIVREATARAVAANIARVHAATAHRDAIANTFKNDATFFAIRLQPYFQATADVHADVAKPLMRLIETTAAIKLCLMHGDVSPKNILVRGDGPLLVDAECACYGDPAFDVAFCLTHLLLKCVWRPSFASAYTKCFDAFAATYMSAVNWEAPQRLEERACHLLAGMLLARVDGKSPVEYLTADDDRARVRRFGKRFLLAPADRLDVMRSAWEQNIR